MGLAVCCFSNRHLSFCHPLSFAPVLNVDNHVYYTDRLGLSFLSLSRRVRLPSPPPRLSCMRIMHTPSVTGPFCFQIQALLEGAAGRDAAFQARSLRPLRYIQDAGVLDTWVLGCRLNSTTQQTTHKQLKTTRKQQTNKLGCLDACFYQFPLFLLFSISLAVFGTAWRFPGCPRSPWVAGSQQTHASPI